MPLSEESDPFARRHFAGSSGGETVPPWNGASGTRARCPVRVDQVQPEPVPDGPGPDQHREGPAPPRSAAETKKPERTANAARPGFSSARRWTIGTTAAPISTGKDRAAHGDDGDDLPDLPGLGGVGLPDEQRPARPITCPACSFQPDHAAALLPAPLPNLPTTPAASPPAPRRQPNAGGVRFST